MYTEEEIRNVISRYTYSKEFISGNGNLVLFFDGDMKDNAIQIKDALANTLSLIVNVDYYAITNEYIINIPINKYGMHVVTQRKRGKQAKKK